MNYKDYDSTYFGKTVDIYTPDNKLVYEKVTPVGSVSQVYQSLEGEVYSFVINENGNSIEVPTGCIFKLSSENQVEIAETL